MEAQKQLSIVVDLKKDTMIPLPQFIQNDTNILEFTVQDNGVDADLSNITRIVVNYKRLDRQVVSRILTATGNTVIYQIGLEEMGVPGPGEMELQFYEDEKRISTKRFKVNILASIGTDEIYENTEQMTVLQELFLEVDSVKVETETARDNADAATESANAAAANAQQVADENKTRFLPAVATVADRASAYPTPAHGDTVRVTGESKTYRYDSVSGWVVTDQYNPTAIDEINVQLAEKATILEVNAVDSKVIDTNARIDNIIATPTTVSEQEIIDARQTEVSLGANITKIKNAIDTDLNNLVTNGDFSNGTTGWTSTNSTSTVANNALTNTASGAGTYGNIGRAETAIANSVYYLSAIMKPLSSACTSLRVQSGNAQILAQVSSPVINQEYRLSARGSSTSATSLLNIRHYYADTTTANGKSVEIKKVLALNLTEIFGAGNEPTKEEMDNLLSKLPNQWWNGSLENGFFVRAMYDIERERAKNEQNTQVSTLKLADNAVTDLKLGVRYLNAFQTHGTINVDTTAFTITFTDVGFTWEGKYNGTRVTQTLNYNLSASPNSYFKHVFFNKSTSQCEVYDWNQAIPDSPNLIHVFTLLNSKLYGAHIDNIKINGVSKADGATTVTTASKWSGKKANFLGDSITFGYTPNSGAQMANPWPKQIGEKLGLAISRNYGISSTTIATNTADSTWETTRQPMVNRYLNMDNDADIVGCLAGINDFWLDIPLGTFDSRDTNTFYGALHTLYSGLVKKYPTKFVFVMTCLQAIRTHEGGITLKQWITAQKEVAEYYSIPVLDMYSTLGINPHIQEQYDTLIPDGLHPNQLGVDIMARKIASFIETH